MNELLFKEKDACISADGVYRYWLTRQWAPTPDKMTFIMLNPSTADAEVDDPTIRRCINFAKREGLAGLRVVNLFAFRSSRPSDLVLAADPVGPENHTRLSIALTEAAILGRPVVAAWGAGASQVQSRLGVRGMARDLALPLLCLGTTRDGQPRHPLYVKSSQPLEVWQ